MNYASENNLPPLDSEILNDTTEMQIPQSEFENTTEMPAVIVDQLNQQSLPPSERGNEPKGRKGAGTFIAATALSAFAVAGLASAHTMSTAPEEEASAAVEEYAEMDAAGSGYAPPVTKPGVSSQEHAGNNADNTAQAAPDQKHTSATTIQPTAEEQTAPESTITEQTSDDTPQQPEEAEIAEEQATVLAVETSNEDTPSQPIEAVAPPSTLFDAEPGPDETAAEDPSALAPQPQPSQPITGTPPMPPEQNRTNNETGTNPVAEE